MELSFLGESLLWWSRNVLLLTYALWALRFVIREAVSLGILHADEEREFRQHQKAEREEKYGAYLRDSY